MAILFDDNLLLARRIGAEHGITPEEIRECVPRAMEALHSFRHAVDSGKCGFPHLPFQSAVLRAIEKYAAQLRGTYETICVIGIGGSALAAWTLDCAFRGPHPVQSRKVPRTVILDNADPDLTAAALDSMNPKKTLVVAVAQSGLTPETAANFLIVWDWLDKALGKKAAQRVAVVTSAEPNDLTTLAEKQACTIFPLPGNAGAQFSVLSACGLLPAALMGLDIRKIAKGAAEMTHFCWQADLGENLALKAALSQYLMLARKQKPIQVAFPYSNRLWVMAFWFRQLWAESLGKANTRSGEKVNAGQTPVAALGATDQHSQLQLYLEGPNDKVFTFWTVKKFSDPGRIPKLRTGLESFDYLGGQTLTKLMDAEQRSTAAALSANGRPSCRFTLDRVDEAHVGAFLQLMEFETAFMGELLNIDAFDRNGVDLAKKFTFGLMGRKGFEEFRKKVD